MYKSRRVPFSLFVNIPLTTPRINFRISECHHRFSIDLIIIFSAKNGKLFLDHTDPLRGHYQTAIWRSCASQDPPQASPEDYGWYYLLYRTDRGQMLPKKFTSEDVNVAPQEVIKLIRCQCHALSKRCERRCSCKEAGLRCTSFCGCND